jgi:UDP-N-acetylmuramate dehydrogenase
VEIQQNVPLAPLTTFQVGGVARWFVEAITEDDVRAAVDHARSRELPLFVLGGGSNLVVADAGFPGVVLKIALRGIEERKQGGQRLFDVAAGEDWDSFVAHSVEQACAGIECLSGIPGTVGGTPVQNVGAYGQEVGETILSVRVYDLEGGEVRAIGNADAGFTYRTSVFNTSQKGRHIVLRVAYGLTPGGKPKLEYADLKKHFEGKPEPSLSEVREAVRQIRASKAMLLVPGDPDCRSAGSFFKNPIVNQTEYARIAGIAGQHGLKPSSYPAPDGRVKLAAAWLVEQAGFNKGFVKGNVGISTRHSLAIVNRGGATAAEIVSLKDDIQKAVFDQYGVQLQPEPVFVGC